MEANGSLCAGLTVGLRDADAGGRAVVLAAEVEEPAAGHEQQVAGGAP